MSFAQEIKDSLTTREVFEFYGLKPNSKGFVCCPFHKEKTPSMKIYEGKRGYYCFGCGASGDVITFIKDFFNISFNDALSKLNQDFSLGFPLGQKIDRRKRLDFARKSFERKRELNNQKKEYQVLKDKYWSAYDLWLKFDQNKIKYAPKREDENFHPLFVEAVHGIGMALHKLEEVEMELYEYEHRNG